MKDPELLEVLALIRDIPEYDLRCGEIGTVVEVYDRSHVEVEFVEDTGYTKALLTLPTTHLRRLEPQELAAARAATSGK